MFLAVFLIGKVWKQPSYSSRDEWIKKMWYTHTHIYEGQTRVAQEKGGIMGLYYIICETFENCKELQNLKNLSFNKKKNAHTHKPGK